MRVFFAREHVHACQRRLSTLQQSTALRPAAAMRLACCSRNSCISDCQHSTPAPAPVTPAHLTMFLNLVQSRGVRCRRLALVAAAAGAATSRAISASTTKARRRVLRSGRGSRDSLIRQWVADARRKGEAEGARAGSVPEPRRAADRCGRGQAQRAHDKASAAQPTPPLPQGCPAGLQQGIQSMLLRNAWVISNPLPQHPAPHLCTDSVG